MTYHIACIRVGKSFRRAGLTFDDAGQKVPVSHFSADQEKELFFAVGLKILHVSCADCGADISAPGHVCADAGATVPSGEEDFPGARDLLDEPPDGDEEPAVAADEADPADEALTALAPDVAPEAPVPAHPIQVAPIPGRRRGGK